MTILRISSLAAFVVTGHLAAYAQPDGSEIWQRLLDNPPSLTHSDHRMAAVDALDEWIARPNSEQMPEVVAYYRRAIDRVLDLLENGRPEKGLRCFQIYSSSVVIQTSSCTFAIDLDQGPNERVRETPETEGTLFCMTDEQIARFVRQIDYSFHTHEHRDHIDFEITKALIDAGKTVVVTDSAKEAWAGEPWADKLVTLKQTIDQPRKVGSLAVDVLWDHQWNNDEHSSGTPCNAYVITTPEGMSVCTKGDINCALRFYGWLQVLAGAGRTIDLMAGSPLYWKGVNLTRQIDALYPTVWTPGHNWEFTHRRSGEPKGNASTYGWSHFYYGGQIKEGTVVVLTWGEYLDMSPGRGKRSSKPR